MAQQPASAIQNICSYTDISATQIACCARHLLAVHGIRKGPASHESGWLRQGHTLALPSASHAEGRRIFASNVARELVSRTSKPFGMLAQISVGPGAARRQPAPLSHQFARARAHPHTHTHARARPHAHAHPYARTHAHKRTPAHTHTRSRAHTWRVPT
jgi:hypothetical protein